MKIGIVTTASPAPRGIRHRWGIRYRGAVRGFAVRITPRRMLAFTRVYRPKRLPRRHEPIAGWDLAHHGAPSPLVHCRECRIPWPCQGHTEEVQATAAHDAADAWANATLGHVTTVTFTTWILIGILGSYFDLISMDVRPDLISVIVWSFLVTIVTATMLIAARLSRRYRRIARTFEEIASD